MSPQRFLITRTLLIIILMTAMYDAVGQDWEEDEGAPYWTEEDEQGGYEEDYSGQECYDPDGLCTSTRIGNIRYNSDGTNSQRVGKRTYHSNGVVCTTIRNTTYCEE